MWRCVHGQAPKPLPIHHQMRVRVDGAEKLLEALEDVHERLRGEGSALNLVHWVVDDAGALHCVQAVHAKSTNAMQHIWLSWAFVAGRCGLQGCDPFSVPTEWLNSVLPWLLAREHSNEAKAMQDALQRQHASDSERLAAERAQLERENAELKAQNTALRAIDLERLVRYLPALFVQAFTVLGAADLALLCGHVEPPIIPNPYPEPSSETLRTLQKQFKDLPHALQQQIVQFVRDLPQRAKLQVRPEMREVLSELERT